MTPVSSPSLRPPRSVRVRPCLSVSVRVSAQFAPSVSVCVSASAPHSGGSARPLCLPRPTVKSVRSVRSVSL